MVRSAATPRVSNHVAPMHPVGTRSTLPMRVRINQTTPAASIERRPFAFRLRQPIGHRIDRSRMMTHAAMAALDLDAFGGRAGLLHASLPGADTVGAAEDRRGRHRRRPRQRAAEAMVFFLGAATARHLVNT